MRRLNAIDAFINLEGRRVLLCRLTISPDGRLAWRYSPDIISTGLPISPLTAPLDGDTHVIEMRSRPGLCGLPGFLADALPDRWGMAVMRQALQAAGLTDPTVCDMLAWQGSRAIGAIEFEPPMDLQGEETSWSLRALQRSAIAIIGGDVASLSAAYQHAAGSAGGAYPKFTVKMNEQGAIVDTDAEAPGYRPVIVKVPGESDVHNRVEFCYAEMARQAGMSVPRFELIVEGAHAWLAIDRFDRIGSRYHFKRHQLTIAGLLDEDMAHHAISAEIALGACRELTQEYDDVLELYRRIVFAYLGHNCDDHGKNISFLMDGAGVWRLAPWYDGAFCQVAVGHAMSLMNFRISGPRARYLGLAKKCGIRKTDAEEALDQVMAALGHWGALASRAGVPEARREEIQAHLLANMRPAAA